MGFFYDQAAGLARRVYDSRIAGPPVLDAETYFPDAGKFAEAWGEIRDEAMHVAARLDTVPRFHEIMREQEDISTNDARDWRLFVLKAYGIAFPEKVGHDCVLYRSLPPREFRLPPLSTGRRYS